MSKIPWRQRRYELDALAGVAVSLEGLTKTKKSLHTVITALEKLIPDETEILERLHLAESDLANYNGLTELCLQKAQWREAANEPNS